MLSHEVTVWCDHDDGNCGCWETSGGTAKKLRRELAARGWVYRSGRDLCPTHRPKGAPRPPPPPLPEGVIAVSVTELRDMQPMKVGRRYRKRK